MIYEYKKYKDISDFMADIPKSNYSEDFTIIDKCNGLKIEPPFSFTNTCFACLFCYFSKDEIKNAFNKFWGDYFISDFANKAFSGLPIKLPNSKQTIKNRFPNLESFTKIDETKNIQPWATGILLNCCSQSNSISMEVPVFNNKYDRNGRLDICCKTEKTLIVMESKTSLDDALHDERFIEQQKKYTSEILKSTKNFNYLTLLGGPESDLYPSDSPFCTGKIGRKTERFYKLIVENNIHFISASALWLMACCYIIKGDNYSWDKIIPKVFSSNDIIGLVSAGLVRKKDNYSYIIEPLE